MDFSPERLLLWIILLPLFGAVLNGLFGRFANRSLVSAVGVGSVAISFLLAAYCFIHVGGLRIDADRADNLAIVYDVYHWFSVWTDSAEIPVHIRFVFDALGGVMTLVVTGIGLLIHIYSTSYMHDDAGYARFFSYLNLFTASMLILVLASNVPLMFVGWEGVGLCSYLLIGFWWENPTYAAAGRKAFVVNRIGDFGVLLAMFLLVMATDTFEFDTLNDKAITLGTSIEFGHTEVGISVATLACLLLFLGCAGKSAQIPLYVWLPDAMAGPTPVSALIHAATMVTAGVYLCCRLSDVFAASPVALTVVAIVGTLTAFIAATIALFQNQMKRILAYSTVSQLGFMFAAVGAGAFAAGIFHVFTHAFFKAALFLGAGSVMHAVHAHGDADIRQLGGLKKWLPATHLTFLFACLAIAGFPLTSGFFSKDDILLGVFTAKDVFVIPYLHIVLLVILAATALLTAFYMFRLYFRTFHGEYRGGPEAPIVDLAVPAAPPAEGEAAPAEATAPAAPAPVHVGHEPHESPVAITAVLWVLGAGSLVVGFLGFPHWIGHGEYTIWTRWLGPSIHIADHHVSLSTGLIVMALGTVVGLGGIWFAWKWYVDEKGVPEAQLRESAPGLYRFLQNKWNVDELYDAVLVRPMHGLAKFISNIDNIAVDGLLTRVTAVLVQIGGYTLTRLQTGVVYVYGAVLVIGIAALGWWFLAPHPRLQAVTQDRQVRAEVGPGLGYEYRWDFESNGEYDTPWGNAETRMERAYDNDAFIDGVLVVDGPRIDGEEIAVPAGDPVVVDPDWFGPRAEWAVLPPEGQEGRGGRSREQIESAPRPPSAKWDDETKEVVLRINDARVTRRGAEVSDDEVRLAPGDAVQIGMATFRVGGRVRVTVQVRNAFGATAEDEVDVTVTPGRRAQHALGIGGGR